jgi:predicted transposase YdaD
MHTDSPFYQLFLLLRESIFYLIDLDPALAQFYDFASVEVKELKRRIDGVYQPQRVEDPFIFVEVQFQPDPTLYQRLVTEGFVYLGQQNPDNEKWLMVAIWPSRSLDPGIPGYYSVIRERIIQVYLDELPLDVQPLGLVLMRMMATDRDPEIQALGQRAVQQARESQNVETLRLVQMLLSYRYPSLGTEELARMFTFSKEEMKKLKVYQEAYQEAQEETRLNDAIRLVNAGIPLSQVAQILELDPSLIQQAQGSQSH